MPFENVPEPQWARDVYERDHDLTPEDLQRRLDGYYATSYTTGEPERDAADGAWSRWAMPLAIVLGILFWSSLWSLVEPYLP